MSCTVNAHLIDNVQATALKSALAGLGIPRDRIRVIPLQQESEHRSDPMLAGGIWGAVQGAMVGTLIGWLIFFWWSESVVGALFGLVTGAIIGGRARANWVGEHAPGWFAFRSTRVEIDAADVQQAEEIRQLCGRLRLRRIRLVRSFAAPSAS